MKSFGKPERLTACGLLTVIFLLLGLSASHYSGRLSHDVWADDVGYFLAGAKWVSIYYEQGIFHLLNYLRENPQHSLYSNGLAALGFLLFGIRDWVPYLMNIGQLFLMLWLFSGLYSGAGLLTMLMGLILLLMLPSSYMVVQEFRPDFMYGLLLAFSIHFMLSGLFLSDGEGTRRRYRKGIALFILSLFVKPSMFLHGAFLFAILGLLFLAAWWFQSERRQEHAKTIREAMTACGLAGIIFGMYVGPHMSEYNELGRLWTKYFNVDGGWLTWIKYFFAGPGSRHLFDGYLYLIGIVLVCFVILRATKGSRQYVVSMLALMGASGFVFLMSTYGSHFFLITFVILGQILFFAALNGLARSEQQALILFGVMIVLGMHPKLFSTTITSAELAIDANPRGSVNADVLERVVHDFEASQGVPNLAVLFEGPVGGAPMRWLAVRDRIPVHLSSLAFETSVEPYLTLARRSDYVLITEGEVAGFASKGPATERFPCYTMQPELLRKLRSDSRFELRATLRTNRGDGVYHLFKNNLPEVKS